MTDYKMINVLFENEKERDLMHAKATAANFESASAYLKFCGFNARIAVDIGKYPLVENLATLRDLYRDKQITHDELLEIKAEVMKHNSKPLIEKLKENT
jgi:hypothetical protein